MTKQSTRDKKITADKGKRDASQATLSFIIGLGSALCFPYRLNPQVQEKPLSSLKPGIKTCNRNIEICPICWEYNNLCVRIIPKCWFGYATGQREVKITHCDEGVDTWNLRERYYLGQCRASTTQYSTSHHPNLTWHLHTPKPQSFLTWELQTSLCEHCDKHSQHKLQDELPNLRDAERCFITCKSLSCSLALNKPLTILHNPSSKRRKDFKEHLVQVKHPQLSP